MAAIALVREVDSDRSPRIQEVIQSFRSQGLGEYYARQIGSATLLWFDSPFSPDSKADWYEDGEDLVACVGMMGFRGQLGRAALPRLLAAFEEPSAINSDEFYGNFQVVVKRGEQAWLFGDALGLIHLFKSCNDRLLSTSWLTCLQLTARPVLDRIGAADYVLNGATHCHRTMVKQITLAPAGYRLDITRNQEGQHAQSDWLDSPMFRNIEEATEAVATSLQDRTQTYLAGGANGVYSAVSGGFDSRLILASLLAAEIKPELFVYGGPDDEDVRVAKLISQAIGYPVRHINKAENSLQNEITKSPSAEENSAFFDGSPIDGLFDNGADRRTRINHARSGKLQLNGGGGEIFRNFFYLRDRGYSATELVWTFYHPFSKDVFVSPVDYDDYVDAMAEGIRTAIGHSSGLISRRAVEAVYPHFRVRFWTSRTNSIVARYGRYYTPLVDPALVRQSLSIPLAWKQYGAFEAGLINRLSPPLGQVSLDYGFTPAKGPGQSLRLKMWLEQSRSPRVRRLTPTIKRALRSFRSGAVPVSDDALTGCALGKLLHYSRLQSSAQRVRAKSVKYLMTRYKIGL